jgi:hypothetical protein
MLFAWKMDWLISMGDHKEFFFASIVSWFFFLPVNENNNNNNNKNIYFQTGWLEIKPDRSRTKKISQQFNYYFYSCHRVKFNYFCWPLLLLDFFFQISIIKDRNVERIWYYGLNQRQFMRLRKWMGKDAK